MSASKRSMPASRASDGFATLTADMMERGGGTPPPLVEASPDAEQSSGTAHASLRPPAPDAKPAFGRKRDVCPLVERRRSVPPRVKVSVRLEQDRHQRLKGAGVLLARTHQDIMTVALDRYLDDLGILKGSD